MKKEQAIELLGGTPKKVAQALGYRAVQTVYLWPDVLPTATADRVRGAAARMASTKQRSKSIKEPQTDVRKP